MYSYQYLTRLSCLRVLFPCFGLLLASHVSFAAGSAQEGVGAPREKIDIRNVQKEYWNKENNTEVEVVQNRLYSKKRTFELSGFVGGVSTDPFASDWSFGGSLGYHLNEYFALNLVYWKDNVSNSSTYNSFVASNGAVPNTDLPKSFKGAEIAFSPLYGKLSVLNQKIVYFDTHLLLGGGIRELESGNAGSLLLGIGEQIYLSKHFSLRVDYRLLRYTETRLEKSLKATLGQPVGQSIRMDSSVTVGLTFLIGPI
jgi:outer membrane beta-barrel protein